MRLEDRGPSGINQKMVIYACEAGSILDSKKHPPRLYMDTYRGRVLILDNENRTVGNPLRGGAWFLGLMAQECADIPGGRRTFRFVQGSGEPFQRLGNRRVIHPARQLTELL